MNQIKENDYADIDDKEHAEGLQLKACIIEVAIEIVNENTPKTWTEQRI